MAQCMPYIKIVTVPWPPGIIKRGSQEIETRFFKALLIHTYVKKLHFTCHDSFRVPQSYKNNLHIKSDPSNSKDVIYPTPLNRNYPITPSSS